MNKQKQKKTAGPGQVKHREKLPGGGKRNCSRNAKINNSIHKLNKLRKCNKNK